MVSREIPASTDLLASLSTARPTPMYPPTYLEPGIG